MEIRDPCPHQSLRIGITHIKKYASEYLNALIVGTVDSSSDIL